MTLESPSTGTVPSRHPIGVCRERVSVNVWPTETNLIYFPGTTKILLTLQLLLIRTVLQDVIENL